MILKGYQCNMNLKVSNSYTEEPLEISYQKTKALNCNFAMARGAIETVNLYAVEWFSSKFFPRVLNHLVKHHKFLFSLFIYLFSPFSRWLPPCSATAWISCQYWTLYPQSCWDWQSWNLRRYLSVLCSCSFHRLERFPAAYAVAGFGRLLWMPLAQLKW